MKKILFILLILVASTFLVGPYFSGKMAEKETVKALNAFNEQKTYGNNELLSYERGFSSSKAKMRYSAPAFLSKKENVTFDYNCDVKHQLIGVNYRCKLDSNSPYGEFVKEKLNGEDPLSFGISASASGAIKYKIDLKPFQAKPEGKGTMNVKKASLSVDTDKDFSKINYDGNFNGLNFKDDKGSLDLGKVALNGDTKKLEGMLYIGTATGKFDSLTVNSSDGKFKINDINFDVDQSEQGETIDSKVKVSIDNIDTYKKDIGEINNIDLAFDWLGVNRQALIDYTNAIKELQTSALNAATTGKQGGDAFAQQMQTQSMALIPVLEKMFTKGMEIDAQLSGNVFKQKSSANLNLKLLDSLTMADSMMFAFAPKEALKKIDLSISNSLNQSLVMSSPNLAKISTSPLFETKGDNYNMELKLGEKIALNGKNMSVEEFQGLVMSAAMR